MLSRIFFDNEEEKHLAENALSTAKIKKVYSSIKKGGPSFNSRIEISCDNFPEKLQQKLKIWIQMNFPIMVQDIDPGRLILRLDDSKPRGIMNGFGGIKKQSPLLNCLKEIETGLKTIPIQEKKPNQIFR